MRMCFRVHMHAYTYLCRYIYMCIFFAVSATCTLQVLCVVCTSAWAGVYVTQVCSYTNVHMCDTLAVGCAHMCICIYVCICMYMHMDAYVRL